MSIKAALEKAIPVEARSMVQFMATDDPSPSLWNALSKVFPNLIAISLDATHLCMAYEYSTWRKRANGSRLLRSIMSKFAIPRPAPFTNVLGPIFTGVSPTPLSSEESILRQQIKTSSMNLHTAERIIKTAKFDQAFFGRVEFVELLAALSAQYKKEVEKVAPGTNRPVREILWSTVCIQHFRDCQ